ncbi:MAG: Flp pilus assembly complex ATPase component TadA, partial [Phycisphaerae bacterium]|nr:Flp pilus assembly complex ATPase component TadA [Phycisphaerae bacterium]
APTGNSEAIHLRVMTVPEKLNDVTQLGFSAKHMDICQETMRTPSGLILVTGATGAGKSSTLYGLASMLDLETKVGMTIEDPIEYNMPFLRQLQVDTAHGLTMNEGLRTILRMDPDVILIGEIRDEQSAMTAARAAMAGRLVIATLHATDAAGAVDALQYLSVPSYVIGSTLRLVIAQSLVRRLCMGCSQVRTLTEQEEELYERFDLIEPEHIFDPVGCPECSSYGYEGRLGIFEMAQVTPYIAEQISAGASKHQIHDLFRDNGTKSLVSDALTKVAYGATSMQEVYQACWKQITESECKTVETENNLEEWAGQFRNN